MTEKIQPMLAKTGEKPFNRKGYIYEPKLDGVRCVAFLDEDTRLQARSGNDITAKFPELANLHTQVNKPCILDGEITGISFNAIQHRIHQEKPLAIRIAQAEYPVDYHIFDILYAGRESVKALPLLERKATLANTATACQGKLVSWQTEYEVAFQLYKNTEGIMAKGMNSIYLEGKRSDSWLKLKNFKEATYCICGLTEGENDRANTFGSLIMGELKDDKLTYVGNVGSGFNKDQLRMMLYLLEPVKGECPFEKRPETDRPVKYWTRPQLKAEIRYLELSPNGLLRFPTFRKMVN
jgi:ATP-dependent DNA ligase